MTDKEKAINELKEALDSLDITNKYRLNLIMAIEYLQEYPVSEELNKAAIAAADEDMQGRQIMEESDEKRQLYSRIFRRGFKAGANWQKALELTWDDIHAIAIIEDKLIHELCLNDPTLPTTQEFYEEVLKRFKTKKEESC